MIKKTVNNFVLYQNTLNLFYRPKFQILYHYVVWQNKISWRKSSATGKQLRILQKAAFLVLIFWIAETFFFFLGIIYFSDGLVLEIWRTPLFIRGCNSLVAKSRTFESDDSTKATTTLALKARQKMKYQENISISKIRKRIRGCKQDIPMIFGPHLIIPF